MTTLISFLGNPSPAKSGSASPRTHMVPAVQEYSTVCYRFENGFEATSLFFGWAAMLHLRDRALKEATPALRPTRWLIIGTPTSGWQMMGEVAAEADANSLELAAAWAARAKSAVTATPSVQTSVVDELLREFENTFRGSLEADIRLRSVDDSSDEIFACLHDNLEPNERVLLDITHGFRTMPVRAVLALGALRWIKGIQVDDILYGGIDKRDRARPELPAPAVSLRGSVRLAEIVPKLASVSLNDDLEAAADCAESLQIGSKNLHQSLRAANVFDSLLRIEESESCLRSKEIAHDSAWCAQSAVGRATAVELRRAAGVGTNLPRADREFRRAQEFLERRDYLRALLLLTEAIRRRIIERLDLTTKLSVEVREITMEYAFNQLEAAGDGGFQVGRLSLLRRTRNAVVHSGKPSESVRRILDSPDQLRRLLRDATAEARKELFSSAHMPPT